MEHYVFADSKNRDAPYGNSYVLHLTKPLRNVSRVDLVSAKIPNSIYNLTDGSNCYVVNGVSFSLAPGFYSAYGLADALTNHMITVEYLPDQGKFIFYDGNPFTLEFNNHEIRTMTGSGDSTTAQTTTGTPYENKYKNQYFVVSENIIDLSTNEFVFLDIEELRTQKVIDSKRIVGESYDGATIATSFAMIPLDVASAQIKTFKETTDYNFSITFEHPIPRLSRLTVRWLNKNGKLINFNGFDNNAFVLRCACKDSAPDPPSEIEEQYDILARKLERAIQDAIPPPPPPPKKPIVPVWVYLSMIFVLGVLLIKTMMGNKKN